MSRIDKMKIASALLTRRTKDDARHVNLKVVEETFDALGEAAKFIGMPKATVIEFLIEDFLELTGFLDSSDRFTLSTDSFASWLPSAAPLRRIARCTKLSNRQKLKRRILKVRRAERLKAESLAGHDRFGIAIAEPTAGEA